ncbi:hypothetical protein OSSY52_00980 [Tepiditoga spiralis]|uniref:ABC transporter permease n=1 Tax=Tepiditoga spiralis TaxID=2108365 RepID=A0A7G1G4Z4_9BACT|nr:hypothetical protein [Tepiditoga spiralis]BBE29957.1 hypothetical protein OSSY52_00980 [Tepiditoga spiralis]
MNNMINKLEAYFMKEFFEKNGKLIVFFLLMLIPNYESKTIFLFLFSVSFLSSDIYHGRYSTLGALPFSRIEIFVSAYTFLISIVFVSQLLAGTLGMLSLTDTITNLLIPSLIFVTAYFSISMIFVQNSLNNLVFPLLIFFADGILSSLPNNIFKNISPFIQENTLYSLIFAFILLIIAGYLFIEKGVQK